MTIADALELGPGQTTPIPPYHGRFAAALPSEEEVAEVRRRLDEAGVKYVMSCWIDLFGIPKTKPVPMTDFEALCAGKGPQFAVHSISYVPELTPADSDQVMVPDLDAVYICPWDPTTAIVFADLY
jgi:glutamine synthetase